MWSINTECIHKTSLAYSSILLVVLSSILKGDCALSSAVLQGLDLGGSSSSGNGSVALLLLKKGFRNAVIE